MGTGLYKDIIGSVVTGTVDRPLGSAHPNYPDMIYPINYGYVDGIFAADGEEQDVSVQGKCIGSSIISELSRFVSDSGFYKIQLGWAKGNPQPEHFWHKNGFCETVKTYDMDDFTVVEARRRVKHTMQLTPSPFQMIKDGLKTIELRLYDEKRRMIHESDTIEFVNTEGTHELLDVRVKNLYRYDSFSELYNNLPLLECGYTKDDISTAAPDDMNEYYSVEEQEKYGVVGIEVDVIKH